VAAVCHWLAKEGRVLCEHPLA